MKFVKDWIFGELWSQASEFRPHWLFLGIPLTISLAILLSTGPYLQHVLFQPIEVGAPSLSEAPDKAGSIVLPSLDAWMGSTFYLPFLVICIGAAFTTYNRRAITQMAMVIGATVFIGITGHDIILDAVTQGITTNSLTQNLVGNLLGGALLAVASAVLLAIYRSTQKSFETKYFRYLAPGLSMLAGSILTSLTIYFVLFFLFQPTAINFEIESPINVEGYYLADKKKTQKSRESRFSFLPSHLEDTSIKIEAPMGAGHLTWNSGNLGEVTDFELFVLSDCFELGSTEGFESPNSHLRIEGPSKLHIQWDEGIAGIEIPKIPRASHYFDHPAPTFYWLNPDEYKGVEETIGLATFLGPESNLITNFRGDTAIFIRLPLMQAANGNSSATDRKLTITYDNQAVELVFTRPKSLNLEENANCKVADVTTNQRENHLLLNSEGKTSSGIILTARTRDRTDGVYSSYQGQIRLSGSGGWARISGINSEHLADHHIGYFSLISVSGKIDMRLDGRPSANKKIDSVTILGPTYGYLSDDGKLILSGRSDKIWLSGEFANISHWEKLESEFQIALIGWLGALLWLVLKPAARLFTYIRQSEVEA